MWRGGSPTWKRYLPLPNYITYWFPFTLEELAVAFEARGLGKEQARKDAEALASEMVEIAETSEMFGGTEVGDFLDPIARLSKDAEGRVAAYRQGLSFDRDWDAQGGNGV